MALINCKECGKQISDQATSCPTCGAPTGVYRGIPKKRTTAAALAIFFGGVGAHKFYLNQTGMGFLYLIFCWTFLPAIVGFIEGLVYLADSDADFQRKRVLVSA